MTGGSYAATSSVIQSIAATPSPGTVSYSTAQTLNNPGSKNLVTLAGGMSVGAAGARIQFVFTYSDLTTYTTAVYTNSTGTMAYNMSVALIYSGTATLSGDPWALSGTKAISNIAVQSINVYSTGVITITGVAVWA